jgi:magnesium-protoporphyrin O-methyltransferase
MICAHCCGLDTFFNDKLATRELGRYQRRGPIRSTRRLIEAIQAEGARGATLLDIGGGIGAIQHELMRAGAEAATDVDASAAYLAAARRQAEQEGYAGRARYLCADFVDVAGEVGAADIVTLDRVICCYPDMTGLVRLSAARARRLYGLVYPRRTWPVKVLLALFNAVRRLRRCPMRVYLHPPAEVHRWLRAEGLLLHRLERTPFWEIALFRRQAVT